MRVLLLVLTGLLYSLTPLLVQAHNTVIVIVLDSPGLPGMDKGADTEPDDPPPLPALPNLKNFSHVSLSGNGDYNNLATAMNAASGSINNPFLILLDPGAYVLSQRLVVKPYVSIRGAGVDLTTIEGSVASNSLNQNAALISGASHSTISQLTVKNLGKNGFTYAMGIYNSCMNCQLLDIKVELNNNTNQNYGIYNSASELESLNVTIQVTSSPVRKSVGLHNNLTYSNHFMLNILVNGGAGSRGVLTENQSFISMRGSDISINQGANRRALDILPNSSGDIVNTKMGGSVPAVTAPSGSCFNVTHSNGNPISC